MEDLYPWSSLAAVNRVVAAAGEEEAREWLAANWGNEFLEADPEVVRRLLPLIDFTRISNRAATALYAVEHDWPEALEAVEAAHCTFLPAFWRNAFDRARAAGSGRCISWLLDRKGDVVSAGGARVLEL